MLIIHFVLLWLLDLLECSNEDQTKIEKQHLILWPSSLQSPALNWEFGNFRTVLLPVGVSPIGWVCQHSYLWFTVNALHHISVSEMLTVFSPQFLFVAYLNVFPRVNEPRPAPQWFALQSHLASTVSQTSPLFSSPFLYGYYLSFPRSDDRSLPLFLSVQMLLDLLSTSGF